MRCVSMVDGVVTARSGEVVRCVSMGDSAVGAGT